MTRPEPAVLATYTRSGLCEGVHVGHAVVVAPDGSVLRSWGDPEHVIFPRSSNKPAQATAMVAAGLDVDTPLLALSAASHSGEPMHLEGVRTVLASVGLDESALQTPSDWPLDAMERDRWVRAGDQPSPIAMNCSGKHAAMLATCVINGWDTATYRELDHPLQQVVLAQVESLAGEVSPVIGVDGCGAPVIALTVAGLARSMGRAVQEPAGSPARRVVDAMRAHPEMVGGSRRDVTAFMHAVPGLAAKDGAEGVYVAALADGRAIAIKSEDGTDRARQVALASILVGLGVDRAALEPLLTIPLLGGGAVVGQVSSPLG